MYRAFNIKIDHNDKDDYNEGLMLESQQQENIKKFIHQLSVDGVLDGAKLESACFPQLSADIFISHSHADKKLALSLSGWLKNKLGLTAFIDSSVWSYAGNILKEIDDKYCTNTKGTTYNYQKRNNSTAHIHVMLCAALTKMMDRTECLMFLNTPSSITADDMINRNKTFSPWIYYELSMADLIQKPLRLHRPDSRIIKSSQFSAVERLDESQQDLKIQFPVSLDKINKLDTHDFDKWDNENKKLEEKLHPLDALYSLHPQKRVVGLNRL